MTIRVKKPMADHVWWRHWWNVVAGELWAGSAGLGAVLHRSHLTLTCLEKGLTRSRLAYLTRLDYTPGHLEDVAPGLRSLNAALGNRQLPVFLAVSRELGFWRQVTLPQAVRENLRQVIAYELDRFLPLPAADVYYDYQVIGETADNLNLALMAIPRQPVDECLALLREIGFPVAGVEMETTAAANAFALLTEKLPSPWLLVHAGDGNLEVAAVRERTIDVHSQTAASGLQELPRLLTGELARLREQGVEPEALCLYGPRQGSRESAALAEAAGLPTFTPARLHLEGWPAEADPETALPALGAALRGVGRVPLPANLLPPESRDRARSGSLLMNKFFLMALVGLLCLWVGSLLIHKRVALYQVNRELASLSGEARQLEKRLQEGKTLTDQLAAFRQKLGQYPDKLRVLRELTRLIPEHTYIFHLRISQQQLEMSGMSKSAADLIPLLERSGWLTKAEFASPIVTDASKLEHFKIKAEIKVVEPAS